MNILKFSFLALLSFTFVSASYKPLPALKSFSKNSYNLKKGVRYVEVREYARGVKDRDFNRHKYRVSAVMQMGAKNPFSKRKLRQFKSIRPDLYLP
jgi:hypothetical protein